MRSALKRLKDRLMIQIWNRANNPTVPAIFNKIQVKRWRAFRIKENKALALAQSIRFKASPEAVYLMKMMNSR